ncbi:hypothetical protein PM082_009496 [Marasmius tenuissimus]|nr:hypothetical protein PM082_009496 [Marasmius tenuissimus]
MSTETFNIRGAVQRANNGRLPLEILHDIFSLCPRSTFNLDESPWVLTQVCRLWRVVAISEPKLWASIDIDFLEIYESGISPANYNTILETVLERTKTTPLHVRITVSMDFFEAGDELVASLGPYAPRVVSLKYIADGEHRIQQVPAIPLPESGFEALERLHYQIPRRAPSEPTVAGWRYIQPSLPHGAIIFLRSVLDAAPKLRRITLSSCSYAVGTIYHSEFNWRNITHLSLFNCSFEDADVCMAEILHDCPNLETLIMEYFPFAIKRRVLLPKLRTLAVYNAGNNIGFFRVPSLQNLTVPGYLNFTFIRWMIQLSHCRLESITVVNLSLKNSLQVEGFLRSVGTHVEELVLKGLVLGHLFDRIGDTNSLISPFLPSLKTIRVLQRLHEWEKPFVYREPPSEVCPSISSLFRAVRARSLLSVEVELCGDSPYLELVSPKEVRRLRMETSTMVEVRVLQNFSRKGHMLERLGSLFINEWWSLLDEGWMDDRKDELASILGVDKRAQDLPVFEDILSTVEGLIHFDNPGDIRTEDLLKSMQILLGLQQIPEVDEEALRLVKERASVIVKWIDTQERKDQ